MNAPVTERACPECQEPVPVLTGYPDWCDRCGWNVRPPPSSEPPADRFTRLTRELGRRSGERLARELLAARDLRPRWTPSRIAAYTVAAAVHLLTLALIAGGIAAIVVEFPNVVSILIGCAMLGVGVLMRPRLDKLEPDQGHALEPDRAPTLHAVAHDVARALDRPPPEEILVDADFNATWRVVGVRRRRVLTLGLPLLASLEPPERVALIAHEIGHDRNGDPGRGLVVGSAVGGLARLADLLQPSPYDEERLAWAHYGPIEWVTGGLMWLVSRPVVAVLWLEAQLLLRDMQRAEYLADAQAVRAAGSAAVVALHERLLLASTCELAVQQAATEDGHDVLDRLRSAAREVPEREQQRRRHVARLETARLDDTHPPTGMRIALIEGRPAVAPSVGLGISGSDRIDAELEPLAARVDRELLDAYRSGLYYG